MEMRFKRFIALLAFILLAFNAAGCARKQPRELLLSAVQKSGAITSYKASGEVRVGLSEHGPGTGLNETVKIAFEGVFQKKPDTGSVKMNVSVGGIGFDIDAYIKDGKTWIKLPVVPAYLLLDPERTAGQTGLKYDARKQQELAKEFWLKLFTEYINSIPGDMMAVSSNRKTQDGAVMDTVVLNLDRQAVDGFTDSFLKMSAEPEFKGLYLPVFGAPAGQFAGLPEARDLKEVIGGLKGRTEVEKLDVEIGVDRSGYIRRCKIDAKYEVAPKGEEDAALTDFNTYASIIIDGINSKPEIKLPDLDKLEVIPLDATGINF